MSKLVNKDDQHTSLRGAIIATETKLTGDDKQRFRISANSWSDKDRIKCSEWMSKQPFGERTNLR